MIHVWNKNYLGLFQKNRPGAGGRATILPPSYTNYILPNLSTYITCKYFCFSSLMFFTFFTSNHYLHCFLFFQLPTFLLWSGWPRAIQSESIGREALFLGRGASIKLYYIFWPPYTGLEFAILARLPELKLYQNGTPSPRKLYFLISSVGKTNYKTKKVQFFYPNNFVDFNEKLV